MKPRFSDSEIDREVRNLFNVDPPSDFEKRVRLRIASTPHVTGPRWAALAIAGAAVLGVLWMIVTYQIPVPTEVPSVAAVPKVPEWATILDAHVRVPPTRSSTRQTRVEAPKLMISPEESSAWQSLFNGPPVQWKEVSILSIEPRPLPKVEMTPLTMVDLTKVNPVVTEANLSNGELK